MDLKLVSFLSSCFVVSVFCVPLSDKTVETLTDSKCGYPPLVVTGDELEWQTCDPSVLKKKTAPFNTTLMSTICQLIQDLEENSCALLKNVSFPIDDLVDYLTDEPENVEKLCLTNSLRDYTGCVETCGVAFSVCDLYVATETLLRKAFSEDVRADFKKIDNFIHSGSLARIFPFPYRGSLHNTNELENCTVLNPGNETKTLCKAVVEVAVNISETGTCMKLDGIQMKRNITHPWEPCEGLPGLLEDVTCDSLQLLKSNETCNNTCDKGGQNICKMIYLGLESLKLSAEKQTKQVSAETVNPAAASKSVNDNPESGGGNQDGGDTSVGEVLDDNDTSHPENEPSGTENKAIQKGGDLHGDKDIQPDTHKDAGKDGHQNIDSGKKASGGINKEAGKEEEENVGKGNQPSGDTGKEAGKEEDQNVGKVNQPSGDTGTGGSTANTDSFDDDDDDDDSRDEDETIGGKEQNADVDTGDGKEDSAKNTEHGSESQKPSVITESEEEEPSGGHFMAYFIVCAVLLVAGYIVFHNKQKIIALVVEGKNAHSGRRPSTKDYKKLKTEDVMPSLEKSAYTKNYVF